MLVRAVIPTSGVADTKHDSTNKRSRHMHGGMLGDKG